MSIIELREAPRAWLGTGRATTWDPYLVAHAIGDPGAVYREVIEPSAFDSAVSGVDAVDLRVNHDSAMRPLASTDAGTLRFTKDAKGLWSEFDLSKDRLDNHDVARRVKAKELRGMSVGMFVQADAWGKDSDGRTELRRVQRARMSELSLVDRPMNPFATIESLRREHRGTQIEYRFVPLTFRDDGVSGSIGDGDELPDGMMTCPRCDGQGFLADPSTRCPECGGTGLVEDDDAGDQNQRRDYTASQLATLGKAGKAIFIDDHWAYPTPARSDFDNAVKAIGRTAEKNRTKVRNYLIKRAKAEGWPTPPAWTPQTRTALAPNDSDDLRERLALLRRAM